jgi:integrase
MAKSPRPFKYRGRWRAQVTLDNGKRPSADFDAHDDATQWITDTLSEANTHHEPELGGPTEATLAAALNHYASLNTVTKGGIDSELNRINHYLQGAGMPSLRKKVDAEGRVSLQTYTPKRQPKGWQEHNDARRAKRARTYALVHELARKRCSAINTAHIRRLMTTMKTDGLSDSTIQKEVALLRHMFNVAAKEWQWKGFENPTADIKLGKSTSRFVFLTKDQEQALFRALAECDNPYVWPLVVLAKETTMRRSSLLAMRWDMVDLDGRLARVPSKTGDVTLPLSLHATQVLSQMPRHSSGRVFPMSGNAVDMAWDGVRIKAGVPALQFRDIRHLGATAWARRGLSAHELRTVLGHKTLHMAQVYVNLVSLDVLNAMDAVSPAAPVIEVPPPIAGSAEDAMNERRSMRMAKAVKVRLERDRLNAAADDTDASAPKARASAAKAIPPSNTPPPNVPTCAPNQGRQGQSAVVVSFSTDSKKAA